MLTFNAVKSKSCKVKYDFYLIHFNLQTPVSNHRPVANLINILRSQFTSLEFRLVMPSIKIRCLASSNNCIMKFLPTLLLLYRKQGSPPIMKEAKSPTSLFIIQRLFMLLIQSAASELPNKAKANRVGKIIFDTLK